MTHGTPRAPWFALALALAVTVADRAAPAAVFQYAVPVAARKAPGTACLWIPPQAERVRGVVVAGMTLMERELAKDPRIRRACEEAQLAIVFVKCGLGAVDLPKVLEDLAEVSGYGELRAAPLLFVGHSAGGPQAKARAIEMAPRCFGLVLYRGGVPGGPQPVPPGVPVLMMVGQFDEFGGTMRDASGRESWQGGRDAVGEFRKAHARNLASILVEPGAGHFAWSERNAVYLAQFLRKAAEARIPDGPLHAREPVACNQIDHATGWLSDLRIEKQGQPESAPYREYGGDRSLAAWHFDRPMAEATVAYHAGGFAKKDQFIKWEDPYWVDAGARFFFTKIKWVDDGQTFEVHPAYADVYPSQPGGRGPKWLAAGKPVGHCRAPIRVKPVSGPVVAAGSNTLRIQFDNLAPATGSARATFLAASPGDDEFRYTEQVGMLPRGFRGFTRGADQQITFPPIGPLKPDGPAVKLRATSDAGLRVEYYVACGPATVEGDRLRVAELPRRAKLPIEVEVVAWQFGRGIEPLVKTAEPVARKTRIERP